MPLPIIWFAALMSAGGQPELASGSASAAAAERLWTEFYERDFPEGRLTYFYDPSSVHRNGDTLSARWEVIGSRDATTTLYAISIDCGAGTFTEQGTLLIDAGGGGQEVPRSRLLVAKPIIAGTSSDRFRRRFCP
jgi:hypothetical protein